MKLVAELSGRLGLIAFSIFMLAAIFTPWGATWYLNGFLDSLFLAAVLVGKALLAIAGAGAFIAALSPWSD